MEKMLEFIYLLVKCGVNLGVYIIVFEVKDEER